MSHITFVSACAILLFSPCAILPGTYHGHVSATRTAVSFAGHVRWYTGSTAHRNVSFRIVVLIPGVYHDTHKLMFSLFSPNGKLFAAWVCVDGIDGFKKLN